MGRLMAASCFALLCMDASAEGITQYQKDAIREYHTKMIMGSGQDLTSRQPDVVLYQNIFKKTNTVDHQQHPEIDQIPWAQVFKKADLSFGETLTLAALASGYDPVFDEAVDISRIVKLNTQPNSLTDLAEYLERVTQTNIKLYPETRMVIVTRKDL